MTAIIGIVKGNKVFIGGDSGVVSESVTVPVSNRKVFKRDDMVIGYAGSFRYGQVLQYHTPTVKMLGKPDPLKYLISAFVPVLRTALGEAGSIGQEDNEEDTPGECLIGLDGRLFHIQNNFSVLEPTSGIATLGQAEDILLGVALALPGRKPEYRINRALSIASNLSGSVAPPFVIEVA